MNDRARVPFALVGVVLLVGSATLSASMAGHDPVTEPRTEAALEDGRAATLTALRTATRTAARRAARRPVTRTANTTVGRSLNGSAPFRSYLSLRVYRRFRASLRAVHGNDAVRVHARLPAVQNATTLQRALARMSVERATPNGSVRVTVSNVTLVATRDGRAVERVRVSPTVTVVTPVLRLHDRTTRFDRRLDRGPTRPGLARGVSARLYALAWGRGYAQYAGGPIPNVVANRHVSLAVNHALLAEQQRAFGRADPSARRGVRVLGARTLGTDLLYASGYSARQATLLREQVDAATPNSTLSPVETFGRPGTPTPESDLTVDAASSSTAAFRQFVGGPLNRTLARTYSADVRLRATTESVATTRSGTRRPGPEWSLVGSRTSTERTVHGQPVDDGERPPQRNGTHVLATYGRRVVERTVTVRRWRRGNRTTTTRLIERRTVDVVLAVVGTHAPVDVVPDAPIRGVHDRGAGPLGGPNLARVESRAVGRLVDERGGVDRLAKRTVAGTLDPESVRIRGRRPDDLRSWVYRDLRVLRQRLGNVSVHVERGAAGTLAAKPAATFATTLRARREAFVPPPTSYDGVASKARHAARVAYFEAVVARLERRADEERAAEDALARRLVAHSTSLSTVRATMAARNRPVAPTRRRLDGVTRLVDVDGSPPVLTRSAVSRARLDVSGSGVHRGLAARNLNLFASPHGDAVDTVLGSVLGDHRVRLRVAAETLRASRSLPPSTTTERLTARRTALRSAVAAAIERRRARLRTHLAAAGVGTTAADRRAVVGRALSPWPTVSGRALALANGSAADRVVARTADRYPDAVSGVEQRDRLRLSLRAAALGGAGVPESAVNRTASAVQRAGRAALRDHAKQVAGRVVNETTERAVSKLERRLGRSLARVPAGLPLTPATWYATTNLWVVRARGEYARFTVRTARGVPGRGIRYVRDGRVVRYDWDGDGTRERLGRSARVDLDVRTTVVVVVPPGGQGVGDTDGDADERSAGWNTTPT